ncbi:MAG TPA: IPT/TIG domain-containing protein, partial [Bryobacteraceae bacterium]|nr:IPT/TIG domain-containing protein [Bryobacteraceae bacterium]
SLLALITEPASGPDGRVILLNLTTGATTSVTANPEQSGGSNDIAIAGNNVFIANQTGGSVSLLQLVAGATTFTGSPVLIRAETGVRALAIDTKDNWLIVTNQGTGNIVLIDLTTRQVVGRIDAVRGETEDKNGKDDRGDRDRAANLPTITSLSPGTGKIDTTFTLTIQGTNLTGASAVTFIKPGDIHGQGKGRGRGEGKNTDDKITASAVVVNAAGTQVTVSVRIASSADPGLRIVRVETPNGETSLLQSSANTFTVVR